MPIMRFLLAAARAAHGWSKDLGRIRTRTLRISRKTKSADVPVGAELNPCLRPLFSNASSSEGKHPLPIVFHAHDRPTARWSLVESTGKVLQPRLTIVGKFAHPIIVVHDC
jgi:hypothetical protein